MARRVLLLASGNGTLARAILESHKSGQLQIDTVGLISDQQAPVLELAKTYGLPTFLMPMQNDRSKWDSDLFEKVKSLEPDLVVSVGFMRILAPEFVKAFKVINTHPSLLPLYPGAHAVRDALAAGASVTGTSIHWVDAGLDTGEVISQRVIDILPGDDETTLHERIKIAERALIVETLVKYGRTGAL